MEETTLNSAYLPIPEPRGVFIGTRKGGQAGNSWPEARAQPCLYGRGNAALLGPRARRLATRAVTSVPCQIEVLVSDFGLLVLTNQLSKVNGYSCRHLITN